MLMEIIKKLWKLIGVKRESIMKKIGRTLIFAGVIMLIGPFFDFTIRSQQDTDYGTGALSWIILISLNREK